MRTKVYRYEIFEPMAREFQRQLGYATEEAILRMRGVVMYSTAKEVPDCEVSSRGTWAPDEVLSSNGGIPT